MDDSDVCTDSTQLSDIELDELVITKYVQEEKKKEVEDEEENPSEDAIETARADCMPYNEMHLSPMHHSMHHMDELLDEHPCLRRPEELKIDGATLLLNSILHASPEHLKTYWDTFEKSKKWRKTSRTTELALVNALVPMVDARPTHLHVFLRRLTEADVTNIIHGALMAPAPTKYRSLLRFTVKTDMPLKQFLSQIDTLGAQMGDMEMHEGMVTGVQKLVDVKHPKKFSTGDLQRLAELEHVLANQMLHHMSGAVKLMLGVRGRNDMTVRVEYHNEIDAGSRRLKTVVIEQLTTPPPGLLNESRVTFRPEEEYEVVEFEIPYGAPYHPLRLPSKIFELVEHLERAQSQFRNIARC